MQRRAKTKRQEPGGLSSIRESGQKVNGVRPAARASRRSESRQEELDKLRRSVTTSTFVAPTKQTFGADPDEWIAGLSNLRSSTVDGYRRNLLYVPAALRAKRLDRVTVMDSMLYTPALECRVSGGERVASAPDPCVISTSSYRRRFRMRSIEIS